MGIWDEQETDWSTGPGLAVRQLFERAYADRAAARAVAGAVGIEWPPAAATLSHAELWSSLLGTAAQLGVLVNLAAELLADPGRSFFATPLRQVLGDQLGPANAARIAKRGLPPSHEQRKAVLGSLDFVSTTEAILPPEGEGQLEAINVASGGSVDMEAYAQTILNARRRVALVRRGQAAVGSGFLVGPDLLLTAEHVLRIDGPPCGKDLEEVEVVLDFTGSGHAIVETGSAVRVKELLRASPATESELLPGPLADWDAPGDRLDFALIRLARAVGHDETPETADRIRGWYRLSEIEPDLTRSTQVMVMHFPKGAYLTWSVMRGSFQYNPAGTKTRLRYRSNTEPGSSGGPIIDEQGRLLALHHRGQQPANQAVPVWRIATAIRDLLGDAAVGPAPQGEVVPAPSPRRTLIVNNRPVVDRDPLRGKLWDAMTVANPPRSLVIVGSADTGVSWSWWLLDHFAAESWNDEELKVKAPHGIKAVMIDLRKLIAGPVVDRRAALIRAVSVPLAATTIADDWPAQAARQISDFKEWCRRQLPVAGPQWWIFVDSIDEESDLTQHGTGEVLDALVDLAYESQVNLRLVLAGRKADLLDNENLGFGARDVTVGMGRQEVKTWLESMADRQGRAVDDVKLEGFLDQWFTTPGPTDRPVQLTLALSAAVEGVSS
ncbi:serine protease [Nocardioides sp. NPDC126508]